MSSVLGTILDPAADKILMTTLTVTLAVQNLLPGMSVCNFGPSFAHYLLSSSRYNHYWTGCVVESVGVLHSLYFTSSSSKFLGMCTPPYYLS
jgi:phosphatidylglycerophosphate synthase